MATNQLRQGLRKRGRWGVIPDPTKFGERIVTRRLTTPSPRIGREGIGWKEAFPGVLIRWRGMDQRPTGASKACPSRDALVRDDDVFVHCSATAARPAWVLPVRGNADPAVADTGT